MSNTEDLINRGAAIDAVYERIKQIGCEDDPYVLSIRQAIRDVPAATKKDEMIRLSENVYRIEYDLISMCYIIRVRSNVLAMRNVKDVILVCEEGRK